MVSKLNYRILTVICILCTLTALVPLTQAGSNIYVFDSKWGTAGSEDGQFRDPNGILVHSNGMIYVCDALASRIQVFKEQALVVTPEAPWGIAAMVASIGGILAFTAVQKSRKVAVYQK